MLYRPAARCGWQLHRWMLCITQATLAWLATAPHRPVAAVSYYIVGFCRRRDAQVDTGLVAALSVGAALAAPAAVVILDAENMTCPACGITVRALEKSRAWPM
jgi:hypothetical protein